MAIELVEYIVMSLVDNKDAVSITQNNRDSAVVIEVKVAQEDMGRIIGKQGRIAKSIRTIIKSATAKSSKKYMVEII